VGRVQIPRMSLQCNDNSNSEMKPVTFQKIRQLYTKRGKSKNRAPLLSRNSVFRWRSVADGFSQFSLFLFTLNSISDKELQTSSIQLEVSKPNQKQMLLANCTPG